MDDLGTGTAADLANNSGVLGVYPEGGWWKNKDRHDRIDSPVQSPLARRVSRAFSRRLVRRGGRNLWTRPFPFSTGPHRVHGVRLTWLS